MVTTQFYGVDKAPAPAPTSAARRTTAPGSRRRTRRRRALGLPHRRRRLRDLVAFRRSAEAHRRLPVQRPAALDSTAAPPGRRPPSGLTDTGSSKAPFITKIAKSQKRPRRLFAVGGVGRLAVDRLRRLLGADADRAGDLGRDQFVPLNVRVSNANPDIVWAGSRMDGTGEILRLHEQRRLVHPDVAELHRCAPWAASPAWPPTRPTPTPPTSCSLRRSAPRSSARPTCGADLDTTSPASTGRASPAPTASPTWRSTTCSSSERHQPPLGGDRDRHRRVAGRRRHLGAGRRRPAARRDLVPDRGRGRDRGRHARPRHLVVTMPALVAGQTYRPLFNDLVPAPRRLAETEFNLRSGTTRRRCGSTASGLPQSPPTRRQEDVVPVPVVTAGTKTRLRRSFTGGVPTIR